MHDTMFVEEPAKPPGLVVAIGNKQFTAMHVNSINTDFPNANTPRSLWSKPTMTYSDKIKGNNSAIMKTKMNTKISPLLSKALDFVDAFHIICINVLATIPTRRSEKHFARKTVTRYYTFITLFPFIYVILLHFVYNFSTINNYSYVNIRIHSCNTSIS